MLADLIGQLAGGAEHQRLRAGQCGVELLQQAKPERGSLAAAGRRLRDDIEPPQDRRQALRLDGSQDGVAQGVDAGGQGRRQRQRGEFVHGAF